MSGSGPNPTLRCPRCRAELGSRPSGISAGVGRRRRVTLAIVGFLLVAFVVLAYRYKGQVITVYDLANEATGSSTLTVAALALGGVAAVCLLGWLMLPFLFLCAWLDLRRRLGCDGRCAGPCWETVATADANPDPSAPAVPTPPSAGS